MSEIAKVIEEKRNEGIELDDEDLNEIYDALEEDNKVRELLDRIPEDDFIDYIMDKFVDDITPLLKEFVNEYGERMLAENIVNLGDEMMDTVKEVMVEAEMEDDEEMEM